MAGEWIKMRVDLPNDPAVYKLATLTGSDRFAVVGRLYAFWSWADRHAVDGRVDGASSLVVDDVTSCPGFADALVAVHWLNVGDDFLLIPNHERHNGESAKERGLKNQRQAKWRAGRDKGSSTNVDGAASTPASTREEKRREDKEDTPLPPQAGAAGAVCKAIRGRGVTDVSPSHPELLALIAQGVSVEAFEAAAEKCAKGNPPKGMAYLLAIVKRQLSEAASIAAGPAAVSAVVDPDSMQAVIAEGVAKGIGPWNEINEQWHIYKARVRGNGQSGPSLEMLARMAELRKPKLGAH